MSLSINNYFALIVYAFGEPMHLFKKSTNMHFNITIAKFGRHDFQTTFCICFIIDLLMQHDLCCVNLIGRSCRKMKNEPNNTHIP